MAFSVQQIAVAKAAISPRYACKISISFPPRRLIIAASLLEIKEYLSGKEKMQYYARVISTWHEQEIVGD